MASATPEYNQGRLVGHRCDEGHLHPSAGSAMGCVPAAFAEEQKEADKAAEVSRKEGIKQDPDFKTAVANAEEMGADDAEDAVFRNGVKRVMEVFQEVGSLRLKAPKKGAKGEEEEPATAPAQPPTKPGVTHGTSQSAPRRTTGTR